MIKEEFCVKRSLLLSIMFYLEKQIEFITQTCY